MGARSEAQPSRGHSYMLRTCYFETRTFQARFSRAFVWQYVTLTQWANPGPGHESYQHPEGGAASLVWGARCHLVLQFTA